MNIEIGYQDKLADMKQTINEQTFVLRPGMHLHLVGIGGAGMSAIAQVLLGRGFGVSGSDQQANERTAALQAAGAAVHVGHHADQIAGSEALVISSAVPDTNPEVMAARTLGLPVLKRSDLLGLLMEGLTGIAVAGSHGKTTTTGMIAQILLTAQLDPTFIIGSELPSLGTNGRFGQGDHFVVEADEYDHMFLGLRPTLAVITNLEHDHPDIFPTEADYRAAFRQFVALLPPNGRLIACYDDQGVRDLLEAIQPPPPQVLTYGLEPDADLTAKEVRANQLGGVDFLVQQGEQLVGLARLRLPGDHNVRNALAAMAVALDLGLEFNTIRQALADFGGMKRRFQVTGEVGEVVVIDDYAHHPTEIRATLAAARQRYAGRRLWAVWQPHTFSRTRLLLSEFATCFKEADRVVALDIYQSRETDTLGMNTAVVLESMNHPHATYTPSHKEAADYILDRVRPGDVVLTLGAGDGNLVGQWVLAGLRQKVGNR
jgi:UDP-N-acetylmuramate--alanine ligase